MSRVSRLAPRIALVALLAALLYALVVCAWQCDDAYITFRTVRNAWTGRGLGFDPHERVQAYTHPLWMIVVALAFGLTREVFVTITVVAIAFGLVAAGMLASVSRDRPWRSVAVVAVLVSSRAFVDYAVCGLENPLLFVVLAALPFVDRAPVSRRMFYASLAVSAAFLTRPDAVLLVLPFAIAIIASGSLRTHRWGIVLGLAPAIAWEVFSFVYYGAFVPNTALAKLNLHVPRVELLAHGLSYLGDSLRRDPVTLAVALFATVFAAVRGDRSTRALAAGVPLYVAYVVWIGGDFMSGRFLGAPLVLALTAACTVESVREPVESRVEIAIAALVLASAFVLRKSPVRSNLRFGRGAPLADILGPSGVADERAYYYPFTGFLPVMLDRPELEASGLPIPPYPGSVRGAAFARSSDRAVVYNEIGLFGWFADDKIVIDRWGLADPLLARIPFRANTFARVGHFARPLPAGYLDTRRTGTNRIVDPALHAAYDDIVLVARDPLFSARRWRAISALLLGRHSRAFD